MSKVSSIKQIKQSKKNSENKYGYLESKGIEKYDVMLELQRYIIKQLYLSTDTYLRKNGFPVSEFVLDDKSARNFLSSDFNKALEGGDESLSISYIAHIDGVEYRTLAYAEIYGETIDFSVDLYKKLNDEWIIYSSDGSWIRGPWEVFF